MESIKNKFTLIEGKFNMEDGKSIVLSFFNTKIMFHNNQILRIIEGERGDRSVIEKKISELEQSRQSIIAMLSEQIPEEQLVEIEGVITIRKIQTIS
jgi:hypothetical protein